LWPSTLEYKWTEYAAQLTSLADQPINSFLELTT
jgi:hypothetical protein